MKFVILLLFCCCAVALARPDGSKEVGKLSSKEVKHSGSGESKESSDKSSNESGNKNDGGSLIGIPGLDLLHPSIQAVEVLLDRGVGFVASLFGLHNIHGFADLIHLIESNPIGSFIWNMVIHPFLRDIEKYRSIIASYLSSAYSTVVQYIPISQLLIPLKLPEAIIKFVFSILHCIAQIFSRQI